MNPFEVRDGKNSRTVTAWSNDRKYRGDQGRDGQMKKKKEGEGREEMRLKLFKKGQGLYSPFTHELKHCQKVGREEKKNM